MQNIRKCPIIGYLCLFFLEIELIGCPWPAPSWLHPAEVACPPPLLATGCIEPVKEPVITPQLSVYDRFYSSINLPLSHGWNSSSRTTYGDICPDLLHWCQSISGSDTGPPSAMFRICCNCKVVLWWVGLRCAKHYLRSFFNSTITSFPTSDLKNE